VVCVAAAFGAAFLVARATDHHSSVPAARTHATAAVVKTTPTTTTNAELVAQFTPDSTSLKPKPKPKPRKRHVHHSAPPSNPAPTVTEPAAPVETTPVYTPTTAAPPPSHSSGSSTHHKSSGGSGTTTIGG
jgi:hypothetical protein